MKETITTDVLERLSLSEILVTNMLGDLTSEQIEYAKELVVERIDSGERHLHCLYERFAGKFLRAIDPAKRTTGSFTNYYDYLRSLYDGRSPSTNDALRKLERCEDKYAEWVTDMVRIYPTLDPKTRKADRRDDFAKVLKKKGLYIETASSDIVGKHAALLIVRRKDEERGIKKIAYRLLDYEINKERENKGKPCGHPKRVAIDDWFGIKLVGSRADRVHRQLFSAIYPYLDRFKLKQDPRREPCRDLDGRIIPAMAQPQGVDDFYRNPCKDNKIIQIKVTPLYDEIHRLREIDLTDMISLLASEMDHVRFSQTRDNDIEQLLKSRREYRRRFNEFVRRGMQLMERMPTETITERGREKVVRRRRKIMEWGEWF